MSINRNRCRIILLLALGIASLVETAHAAAAYQLIGRVQDGNGAPVTRATLILFNARQTVIARLETDEEGRFRIADLPAGTYELEVASRGFATRRVSVVIPSDEASNLIVTLGISGLKEEVTVSAEIGIVQGIDESAQRVNVIDEEQLAQRATSVVAQIANEETGINLQRTSSSIGAIFIRGLTGAKVATYIDGVRFSTSAARGGINTFFNLNDTGNLRAVEILRGPNSAQFGSDSLGGAVQLISRVPLASIGRTEVHGRISTSYSSADQGYGGNALVTIGAKDLAMLISLAGRRNNTLRPGAGIDTHAAVTRFLGLPSTIFGERMTDTAFTQYGGLFRLTHTLAPTHQLTFHYQREQQDGGKRYDQTLGGDGNLIADLRNLMLDFFYLRYEKLGAGWFDTLALSYSHNSQREERVNQGGNGNPLASISHQYERTSVNGLQAQLTSQINARHNLAVGGEFYYDFVRAPSYTFDPANGSVALARGRLPDRSQYYSGGIYLQDVWTAIPERLRLSAALRYSRAAYRSRAANSPPSAPAPLWPDDSLTAQSITPRLSAVLTVGGGLNLSFQVSRGFRAPHITDLATLGLTGNGYEASQTDVAGRGATIGSTADRNAISTGIPAQQLKPETSWSYEGGFHFRRPTFDFDLTMFLNEIYDNIAVQSLILPAGAVGARLGDQTIVDQLSNGVVFVPLSTNPVLIRANFDRARIIGVEQRLDWRIIDELTFSNTFTWLRSEDRQTGRPPNIEGGTPAPQGWVKLRYQPGSGRYWIEPYLYAAGRQPRLSTLDLEDRRTGATRSRNNIRNFFYHGATARGLVAPGPDGRAGTADDVLVPTRETLAQVQDRVLGVGVPSAPLAGAIPGFLTINIRGGLRLNEQHELIWDLENLGDRNYRGISWGLDAPGRGFNFRYIFNY